MKFRTGASAALLAIALAAHHGFAANAPLPPGWTADAILVSGTCDVTAVALAPASVSTTGGAVLVTSDKGEAATLHFPGEVLDLDLSPTGTALLVTHGDGSGGRHVSLRYLDDTPGWTRADGRIYRFSTTGEVISARRLKLQRGKPTVEVMELDGTYLVGITSVKPLVDALVIGRDEFVLALDRRLLATNYVEHSNWNLEMSDRDPRIKELRRLEHGRWAVTHRHEADGLRTKVFGDGEEPLYAHSPGVIEAMSSRLDWEDWQHHAVHPTTAPDHVLLVHAADPRALSVNTESGDFLPVTVDVEPPPGTARAAWVGCRLVFIGPDRIVTRSLETLRRAEDPRRITTSSLTRGSTGPDR